MKNLSSFTSLLTRPFLREEIDCEFATRSLRQFVRQAWAVVEPSTPFVPGWHIDAIVNRDDLSDTWQWLPLGLRAPQTIGRSATWLRLLPCRAVQRYHS